MTNASRTPVRVPPFHRVAEGDYETEDGVYRLYRLRDVNPPAWNVEDVTADVWATGQATDDIIVDGAGTKRDALALFARWYLKEATA